MGDSGDVVWLGKPSPSSLCDSSRRGLVWKPRASLISGTIASTAGCVRSHQTGRPVSHGASPSCVMSHSGDGAEARVDPRTLRPYGAGEIRSARACMSVECAPRALDIRPRLAQSTAAARSQYISTLSTSKLSPWKRNARAKRSATVGVTIVLIVVPFFLPLFQVGHFPTETFANISGLKSHSFCVRLVIDGAPSRAADTLFQLVVDTHGHPTACIGPRQARRLRAPPPPCPSSLAC